MYCSASSLQLSLLSWNLELYAGTMFLPPLKTKTFSLERACGTEAR
jgi:hypothetical protein